MIKTMTPNLMVRNVNETVEYYQNILGFELVTSVPDSGTFDWAMMKYGPVEIMFQTAESLAKDLPELSGKTIGATQVLYTRVENIKELHNHVNGKATVVHGLQKTFYGMEEFTIKDLNGYFVTFAQPVQ